jgi:hypothetical protein
VWPDFSTLKAFTAKGAKEREGKQSDRSGFVYYLMLVYFAPFAVEYFNE